MEDDIEVNNQENKPKLSDLSFELKTTAFELLKNVNWQQSVLSYDAYCASSLQDLFGIYFNLDDQQCLRIDHHPDKQCYSLEQLLILFLHLHRDAMLTMRDHEGRIMTQEQKQEQKQQEITDLQTQLRDKDTTISILMENVANLTERLNNLELRLMVADRSLLEANSL
jgi:hypothetical protein